MSSTHISRRSFAAMLAAGSAAMAAPKKKPVIGVELYSVRDELKKDLFGTVRGVAKMGYEGVEFFSPYYEWTPEYAKEVRKLLDDVKLKCLSTHNSPKALSPDGVGKAVELNGILGSKFVVMASAGRVEGLDGWRKVAETLNSSLEKLKPAGMLPGFHNHQVEWKPIDGTRPLELLAKETSKDVVLQLDVGTAVETKTDIIAWINANPGRLRSIHLKDFSAQQGKGYHVLFGEGDAPWKQIFKAAEAKGGVEHYLIEQEGSALTPMETIEKCLANYRKMRA